MYYYIYAFDIAFENSFEVSTRLACFNNFVSVKVNVEFASFRLVLMARCVPGDANKLTDCFDHTDAHFNAQF